MRHMCECKRHKKREYLKNMKCGGSLCVCVCVLIPCVANGYKYVHMYHVCAILFIAMVFKRKAALYINHYD